MPCEDLGLGIYVLIFKYENVSEYLLFIVFEFEEIDRRTMSYTSYLFFIQSKKKKHHTSEYTNEAYQPFPEEDEEYKISGSDDNDDVSTDESGNESNNDSAYQTISKSSISTANGHVQTHKRKSTKKIR